MKLEWLDPEAQRKQPLTLADLTRADVFYEFLELDPTAYQPALDRFKEARGYPVQDIVELSPATPNLEALLAKFIDEHLHTDDEVRYVLAGEGIFDIRSVDDRWMRITVEAGDLLAVPAHRHHRFLLTETRQIRCVRLFKDQSGWVPHYRVFDAAS